MVHLDIAEVYMNLNEYCVVATDLYMAVYVVDLDWDPVTRIMSI